MESYSKGRIHYCANAKEVDLVNFGPAKYLRIFRRHSNRRKLVSGKDCAFEGRQ